MGCTNAKPGKEHLEKLNKMVNELVVVYASFEEYIRAQRVVAIESLVGGQKNSNSSRRTSISNSHSLFIVSPLISVETDIVYFKQFKKLNKYKYDITVSKFLKNINYCLFKLQGVFQQHSACLSQLNVCKQTTTGQQFINRNTQILTSLTDKMLALGRYLDVSPEFTKNLALETSECLTRTENGILQGSSIEIKSQSQHTIPETSQQL